MAEEALTGVSGAGAVGSTVPDVAGGTTSIALTGVAGVGTLGSVGYGEGFALTGESADGWAGLISTSQAAGQILRLDEPAWALALTGFTGATGDVEWEWPARTLALTGLVGSSGDVGLDWPTNTLALTGLVGSAGALALQFPSATLALGSGNTLDMQLPPAALALTGTTGAVGALKLNWPRFALPITGTAHVLGAAVLTFPTLRMAVTGDTGRVGQLALSWRALSLAVTGGQGITGALALTLPIVQLDVAGYGATSGSLELLLPVLQLQLDGGLVQAAGVSEAAATTLVMQTERGALTRYTNYPFNSFAAFNGVFLGACDDGVFALTGADDAGTAIAAAARVGVTDFGTSHTKRIERIYVGYRSTGRMILRVVTEERWTRDYALEPVGHAGLHGGHVRLGRGLEARYWQFEVQNQDGGDFDLDMLEMKPIKLKRRVGGGNA